jgi:hypothetical protein
VSALAAVDRILDEGGDADDVLRAVVEQLVTRGGAVWAGILFVENGELVLGPQSGKQRPGNQQHGDRIKLPVVYDGERVAELVVDGCADRGLLERVALLISSYCLVGWDTGGLPWDPDA